MVKRISILLKSFFYYLLRLVDIQVGQIGSQGIGRTARESAASSSAPRQAKRSRHAEEEGESAAGDLDASKGVWHRYEGNPHAQSHDSTRVYDDVVKQRNVDPGNDWYVTPYSATARLQPKLLRECRTVRALSAGETGSAALSTFYFPPTGRAYRVVCKR